MPINKRSFALSIATAWFFLTVFIGWIHNMAPATCGRKAFVGAIVVYMVCSISASIINRIVIDAVASHHINSQEGNIK